MRRCRTLTEETGRRHEIVGAYHSHPRTAPVPSPTDRAQAFGEFVYLIAGPAAEIGPIEVRGYRLEGGEFEAVTLEPC
jgi:proteasome lid subunit RPN8/RPN11